MTIATRQAKKFKGNNFYTTLWETKQRAIKSDTNGSEIVLTLQDNSVVVFNNKHHTVEEFREIKQ